MDWSRADINILKIISKNYYAINFIEVMKEFDQIVKIKDFQFDILMRPYETPIDFELKTIRFNDKNYPIDEIFDNQEFVLNLNRSYNIHRESLNFPKYYFNVYNK